VVVVVVMVMVLASGRPHRVCSCSSSGIGDGARLIDLLVLPIQCIQVLSIDDVRYNLMSISGGET
jgi:hypothetical protein